MVSLKSVNKLPNTKVFIAAEKWMVRSAYIELLMHLGSLGSTQEARAARGDNSAIASCNSYASFVLSKLVRYTHAKHEKILNYNITGSLN